MAIKTKVELQSQIDSLLGDNSTGDISAADVRTCHTDAVDSLYEIEQRSYQLFKRAGIFSKDDNLFPNLITMLDYEGVTSGTTTINRNVFNNLIIDSIVDQYDFEGSTYTWTQTWLDTGDLLANRAGDTVLVIT